MDRRADDPRWKHFGDRMEGFEKALHENTSVTREIKKSTDEIVAFFEAGKGFFRVVRWLGVSAKWFTMVAGAALTVWALFRYGVAEAMKDIHDMGDR